VLTIDTASLLRKTCGGSLACPMNWEYVSVAHRRGHNTFQRITDYPCGSGRLKRTWSKSSSTYSVSDIAAHVTQVRRMRGDQTLEVLKK